MSTERSYPEHRAPDANRASSVSSRPDAIDLHTLAEVSHDLRTPLSALLGCLTLLEDTRLDGTQRALLAQAVSSGESLLAMLDASLLASQACHAESTDLPQIAFSLRESCSQWLAGVAPLAQAKGLDLWLDLPAETPDALQGDAPALERVVSNLLANAIKFTDFGAIRLVVDVQPLSAGTGQLELRVIDRGPGLGDDPEGRLFKPFVRGHKASADGHGLGLAICNRLVEQMAGSLQLSPAEGGGCESRVAVPITMRASQHAGPLAQSDTVWVLAMMDESLRREWRQWAQWRGVPWRDGMEDDARAASTGQREAWFIEVREGEEDFARHTLARARQCHGSAIAVMRSLDPRHSPPWLTDGFDQLLPYRWSRQKQLDWIAPTLAEEGGLTPLPAQMPDSGWRLLVVDDDALAGVVLRRRLAEQRVRVDTVTSLQAGLEALRSHVFDAVLVDFHLPDGSGLNAVGQLRNAAAGAAPVVIGTSCEMAESARTRALENGLDDYLEKPVTPDALLRALSGLI